MSTENEKMTREEMHTEALVIECLLDTAQAMFGAGNEQDLATMVEMAHTRPQHLKAALDSVNAHSGVV